MKVFSNNDKFGVMNEGGNLIIDALFDRITITDDYIIVCLKSKRRYRFPSQDFYDYFQYGVFNNNGEQVLPIEYCKIIKIENHLAFVNQYDSNSYDGDDYSLISLIDSSFKLNRLRKVVFFSNNFFVTETGYNPVGKDYIFCNFSLYNEKNEEIFNNETMKAVCEISAASFSNYYAGQIRFESNGKAFSIDKFGTINILDDRTENERINIFEYKNIAY
jgi:hypothetical protein